MSLPATLSEDDRLNAAGKGAAFARECEDLLEPEFESTLLDARALIRQTMEGTGVEHAHAFEVAEIFSKAAVNERRRIWLETANPGGTA